MCPRHGCLAEHQTGRSFLSVGIRDVQAHAARTAGTHFDIGGHARIPERTIENLDMGNQLGHVHAR